MKVRSAGPARFEASVGPLPGKALAMAARLLTLNPGLTVSVAFTESDAPPGDGILWLDPRRLDDDQVPQHPGRNVYMHLATTLAETGR